MPSRYNLTGSSRYAQVEPSASFWSVVPAPRALTFGEILKLYELPAFEETDSPEARKDLDDVRQLTELRLDQAAFEKVEGERLSHFLRGPLFVDRPPAGAVVHERSTLQPFLKTGTELARLFEAETPGFWHRHVLNVFLDPRRPEGLGVQLSPPRQALIWAVLDVAISCALNAAWLYKWRFTDQVSFRERPYEAALRLDPARPLSVAYDFELIRFDGDIRDGSPRNRTDDPQPSPGTPRHPSYPSGHSAYSAAASTVLGCMLSNVPIPDDTTGLNAQQEILKLALNIGSARLWAGVNWIQDDAVGRSLGNAIGKEIIFQLNASGINVPALTNPDVPDQDLMLYREAYYGVLRKADDVSTGLGMANTVQNPGPQIADAVSASSRARPTVSVAAEKRMD